MDSFSSNKWLIWLFHHVARFEELLKRSKEEEREYDYTLEYAKRMLEDEKYLCETRNTSSLVFQKEKNNLLSNVAICNSSDEQKSSDSEGMRYSMFHGFIIGKKIVGLKNCRSNF